jgi:hypothetical protein
MEKTVAATNLALIPKVGLATDDRFIDRLVECDR